MQRIAEFRGNMLNHVEALYRPGERELVLELAAILGCAVTDTGIDSRSAGTYLAIHPETDDQDPVNNAIYASQVAEEQYAVETAIMRLNEADQGLGKLSETYREAISKWPFGFPHFGLRYKTEQQIEDVAIRARNAAPTLRDRVQVLMFHPGPDSPSEFIQGFVRQDVLVAGSFFLGQLIELQYQPISR